jgi:hypothetical protein
MTLGSMAAGWPAESTTVATIMSQRLLKTIDSADLSRLGPVRDAGRAIAGAELGAEIELDLAAAIGRLAGERATGSPLIDWERPLHLGPDQLGDRCAVHRVVCGARG